MLNEVLACTHHYSADNAALRQTMNQFIEPRLNLSLSGDRSASLTPQGSFIQSSIQLITSRLLSSLVVSPASDAKTARLVDRCSQFAHTVNEELRMVKGSTSPWESFLVLSMTVNTRREILYFPLNHMMNKPSGSFLRKEQGLEAGRGSESRATNLLGIIRISGVWYCVFGPHPDTMLLLLDAHCLESSRNAPHGLRMSGPRDRGRVHIPKLYQLHG